MKNKLDFMKILNYIFVVIGLIAGGREAIKIINLLNYQMPIMKEMIITGVGTLLGGVIGLLPGTIIKSTIKMANKKQKTNVVNEIVTLEENKEKVLEDPIIIKSKTNKYSSNTIDNIMLDSPNIGIKLELLSEWQEYLENTMLDSNGMYVIQELIYYFVLINTLSMEKVIPLIKEREDLIDILIHFSNNGDVLAKSLNREEKQLKKERI